MSATTRRLAALALGTRPGERVTTAAAVSGVVGTLALGYLAYRATTLASNAGGLHRLGDGDARDTADGGGERPSRHYRISLLVPARDEEHTLRSTLPLLLDQGADEVVVLDDHSGDATARVARELGARVLTGEPLPDGWIGKTWACQQLADDVTAGDGGASTDEREHLLVFTDADVTWRPGALDELVEEMERGRTDLLTVFPRHRVGSFGERLMVPLVDAAFVGHAPVPIIRSRRRGALAANGQVMAFRRAAYELAGGHAAVRGELVEDVRLARRARDAGARFDVVLGGAAIEVRMYDSYAAAVEGMAKSMPGLHRESRLVMVGAAAWFAMTYTLPWLLPATPLIRLVRALGLADRAAVNVLVGRTSPAELAETFLGPISPLAVLPAYARAISGRLTWRGRTYPAARRGWRP